MARTPTAEARLRGAEAAKILHQDMGMRQRVESENGAIDVYDTIAELGVPLVFKPLNSALGLCLPEPVRGIIISTKRVRSIQRFTAAHELGHVILDHKGSVDFEILERAPLPGDPARDLQEVEADAFAAEFLLPRWLYRHHIRRQKWKTADHLRRRDIVYQLALRLGASYEATCLGLVSHQILPKGAVDALLGAHLKSLKLDLGDGESPANPWADSWRLTPRDNAGVIKGSPEDLLRFELEEKAGAGFAWSGGALEAVGLDILKDKSEFDRNGRAYGGTSVRTFVTRPRGPIDARLEIAETRPWAPGEPSSDDASLNLRIALTPKESGMSFAQRRRKGVSA